MRPVNGARASGAIPMSGYRLRREYQEHDAERIFAVDAIATQESTVCISGLILQGLKKPHQCPAFGKQCTPHSPLGATMVSSEGACAAYYAYGRHLEARGQGSGARAGVRDHDYFEGKPASRRGCSGPARCRARSMTTSCSATAAVDS